MEEVVKQEIDKEREKALKERLGLVGCNQLSAYGEGAAFNNDDFENRRLKELALATALHNKPGQDAETAIKDAEVFLKYLSAK